MNRADPLQLWYYRSTAGVLPDGLPVDRAPWTAIGGGGTLAGGDGVTIHGTAARKGYEASVDRSLVPDRVEVQARFAGSTNAPTWAPGTPGHVLWIDDGLRALGVAIGPQLAVVNPVTGAALAQIAAENLPGGWTIAQHYHLFKVGSAFWELRVGGRLVFQLPYGAGADSSRSVATVGWGWQDPTALADGSGVWDEIEVGINEALPPQWQVDRARNTLPVLLQQEWTDRNEAILRATIGLAAASRDRMNRVLEEFAGAVATVQAGDFDGTQDPTIDGWAVDGTGTVTIERERIRIDTSTDPTYARWDFDPPTNLEAVYRAAARFNLRDWDTTATTGRAGPFVSIRDGAHQISAVLLQDQANREAVGWILVDGDLSSALGNTGDVFYRVATDQDSYVELYVIGQERVALFVDGDLVEDVPYSRFTEAASEYDVRIGRDGSATISAVVDLADGLASLSYGDTGFRPLFLRRVAERLLFAGGLERNDQLDTWMKHRPGVFEARGTDRVASEIRRIACDDDADVITQRQPGSWFLGVTFPGVSPVFLGSTGTVPVTHAEFHALAPNFSIDELTALITRYLLPANVAESRFYASLVTDLVTDTTTTTETTFDVVSPLGFRVGDLVTLRGGLTGTMLTLDYEGTDPLAADLMLVSTFNGPIWADWFTSTDGEAADEISGLFILPGLLGDRLATITSGNAVKVSSNDLDEDIRIEVFGLNGATAVSEVLHVVGTTVTTGTQAFTEVHGTAGDELAQGTITIADAGTSTALYQIAPGAQTSGAYLFDPPLHTEPARMSIVANGATTATLIVAGVERGGVDHLTAQALNGTTPVSPTTVWSSTRALAMGYVSGARQVAFFDAVFADERADYQVVSDNAADTQLVYIFGISTHLEPFLVSGRLTGTTPLVLPSGVRVFHTLGVYLQTAAVGTVTVRQIGEVASTLVATIGASTTAKGVDLRRIATVGQVGGRLDASVVTPRWALVFGYDNDGDFEMDVLELAGTDLVTGSVDWSEVRGICSGNVPTTRTIQLHGKAFRYNDAVAAQVRISDLYDWSVEGPAIDPLDGILAPATNEDATAGTVTLTGTWSHYEQTQITDIADETITTTALADDFATGSRMRLDPP